MRVCTDEAVCRWITKGRPVSEAGQQVQNRYQLLDKLGEGGMGTVWRALDRLTGQHIALKQVRHPMLIAPLEQTGAAVALGREFQTLSGLRHPNIISVLDYGFDHGQPYLTMTLLADSETLSTAGIRRLNRTPHEVLLDVLAALTYLHRRGVMHCDLKLTNILLDANGVTRLIDFGIATAQTEDTNKAAGTLQYIAPELLSGGGLSPASDLYALGVIAYELYAGVHPFKKGDVSGLIARVLYDSPDVSVLPASVRPWVSRLLSKTPNTRYPSASAAAWALCNALDIPLPPESADIRDSFIQAARFVGRERELIILRDALGNALDGRGAAIIVSGESGVGKSRLVDEVRVQALVKGALAVRGQAAEGGGLPYQLWRDIVPILLLEASVSARDVAALSLITPDIHRLTGHAAPKRLPKDAHQRLPRIIAGLIRAQTRPLIMIWEDVQWAGDSLGLMSAVIPLTTDRPVLVIATHRSDEQPNLPDVLAECALMRLERLTPDAVAELSAAILGDAGRSEALVGQLQRETEGNAFFLVEVVRALAEDAGSLDDIEPDALFTSRLTGGLRALMRRRLDRLPMWARPLLQVAVVAGRRLDPALLAQADGLESPYRLEDWLTACADCALIEVADGAWRFCHDKIRESLLSEMDTLTVQTLNRTVAQAMEKAYPSESRYASKLALHWARAGEWAQAMNYVRVAVKGWRAVSGYKEAQGVLNELLQHLPDGDSAERAEILTLLGEMYIEVGMVAEAYGAFSKGTALSRHLNLSDLLPAALVGLVYFEYRTGNVHHALEMLEEVLNAPNADPLTRIRGLNLKAAIYDVPPTPESVKALIDESMALSIQHDLIEGRMLTYQNATSYYMMIGDTQAALNGLYAMLELSESTGNSAMTSSAYVNLIEIYIGLGNIDKAESLMVRLEEMLDLVDDLYLNAWAWKLRARISYHKRDLDAAINHFLSAIAGFGDMQASGEIALTRACVVLYMIEAGRLMESTSHLALMRAEAEQAGNSDLLAVAVGSYALVAMHMGDSAQAADWRVSLTGNDGWIRGTLLEDILPLLDSGLDPDDVSDAEIRARYPDITAAFESLADSGW